MLVLSKESGHIGIRGVIVVVIIRGKRRERSICPYVFVIDVIAFELFFVVADMCVGDGLFEFIEGEMEAIGDVLRGLTASDP